MRAVDNPREWRAITRALANTQFLQSWEWGEFRANMDGWTVSRFVWEAKLGPVAAAQVLRRTEQLVGLSASLMYVPRGPLLNWSDTVLPHEVLGQLANHARHVGAMFVKIDPALPMGYGVPGAADARPAPVGEAVRTRLVADGWRFSSEQIQFRNTVLLDITASEESLLASFKQKTRYNIRLAGRRGVQVRKAVESDLPALLKLYAETSERDGFVIRSPEYYSRLWQSFMRANKAIALIAEVDGEPVGGVFIVFEGRRAAYLTGMSSARHREKMANHLLQWEAIRTARARGCTEYDLWGAPDVFDESDSMWGVWRFKSGFRGTVVRTLGAWDYPVQRAQYWTYNVVMPRLLALMRRRRRRRTLTAR
ncbi:MAG: lipid II:glycine glycyltransferase FemX [Anaerolineales bacterium]